MLVFFLFALIRLFPADTSNNNDSRFARLGALPASAIHMLMGTAEAGSLEFIGILPAFLVLGSWLLMSGATAIWKFQKKDI